MFPPAPFFCAICAPCQSPGPHSPSSQPSWLASLKSERESTLRRIGYSGGVFSVAQLAWTQRAFIQPQMHPYDRYFYDAVSGKYTVRRYLDDLTSRYGGIDAVLMWPTYTNLGVDDRNQFDFFRTMPGGLDSVSRVTKELKAAGVRVLWPYNPWDEGTRREPLDDARTIAMLLNQTGGDGFNGDTMQYVPRSFWRASVEIEHPLAIEPEDGGTDMSINWQTMGWGYWSYPHIPQVDRFKFLTFGKYMTHICDRWALRKTDNLQAAWFNGVGYEAWENVWGSWNGIVPRDAEAIRRVATLLRFFGGPGGLLQSAEWEPHSPDLLGEGIFASLFPNDTHSLYTVVNRAGRDVAGARLRVPPEDARYFDCYHGKEIHPSHQPNSSSHVSFDLEVDGYGCVLKLPGAPGPALEGLLHLMASLTSKRLDQFSAEWKYAPQTMVQIAPSKLATSRPGGMVLIPATGNFSFTASGIEIEGDAAHGVDVQFPWEAHPQRNHSRIMSLNAFYMDKYPATNADYSHFLNATGYRPTDTTAWLRHWRGASEPPVSLLNMPVTYLSLNDARAFCSWRAGGSRLPHAYEWQYAAQGHDQRLYPWGNFRNTSNFATATTGTTYHGPESVMAHARDGDSPFGVSDLVGNVWQFTNEFHDDHTRFVILRGGSNYRPSGSKWYFPNQIELNTYNKYFLFSDSYERAATIGVRCVKDIEHEH